MIDPVLSEFIIKGGIAFLCGFIIGLEREIKGKASGLRTSVIICIGSALFTALGFFVVKDFAQGDPTRVFAQIIQGIGFLGAGVIIQSRGNVFGLTTASTIWITSAVGITVGVGLYEVAIYSTLAVVITLVLLKRFENRFLNKFVETTYQCEITFEESPETPSLTALSIALNHFSLSPISNETSYNSGKLKYCLTYKGKTENAHKFVAGITKLPRIISFSNKRL